MDEKSIPCLEASSSIDVSSFQDLTEMRASQAVVSLKQSWGHCLLDLTTDGAGC